MAALKLIRKIKKAEDKAREMIEGAEIEAALAIEEAKRKATDKIEAQRKASIRMEEEAMERATEEAQGAIEGLRERGRKELARIRGTARENMDQAVKRIMEEL